MVLTVFCEKPCVLKKSNYWRSIDWIQTCGKSCKSALRTASFLMWKTKNRNLAGKVLGEKREKVLSHLTQPLEGLRHRTTVPAAACARATNSRRRLIRFIPFLFTSVVTSSVQATRPTKQGNTT